MLPLFPRGKGKLGELQAAWHLFLDMMKLSGFNLNYLFIPKNKCFHDISLV